jgi:hypothetical protein
MKRDAATAFKAIISARKASAEGCWQSVKENFTCHTAVGVLFALVALTEVFTNTMIIIFAVVKDKTTCYMGMRPSEHAFQSDSCRSLLNSSLLF